MGPRTELLITTKKIVVNQKLELKIQFFKFQNELSVNYIILLYGNK